MKNKTIKSVTHNGDVYNIPFNITCTVSGLTKVYTSEEYINGKLDRFKGLENLRKTYVCRDAKKLLKAGKTPDEVKQILNKVAEAAPTPEVKTEVKVSLAATSVTQSDVQGMEVKPEVDVTPEQAPAAEVKDERPIATKDKRGFVRDEKGRLIKKSDHGKYNIVEKAA
jgi:hypothetical protein